MADTVSTLRAVYEADSSGFDRALDSIQGGIGKTVGALVGLAGAIGVSFAAGDTIQRALEFDKAMSNIRAVTGDTVDETAALGDMLKNTAMNSAIPGGLDAISQSYYAIVGGVGDAAAQQDIFNAAIATAEAGQADLGAVTDGLITAVNSYGAANLSASTASDVLSATTKLGTKSMGEYVTAIGPIAGVMASVGVKFQDVGAMMAFMTTKGASAGQSATRLQAATVALINPNKDMADLLKKIGVESGTAAIQQYGLAGTLDKLKQAAGGSVEDMSKALGSVEALGAATALTDAGFKDFTGTFYDAAEGATAAARALQLESVSAQFQIFQNTLSGIGLSIGQAFLPALNTLLGGFNAFAGDVQKMGLGPAIEKWWNAGVDWLQTNGPAILQGALKMALDIGQDIVTFVQTNGPNVVAGIIGLWEGIKTWFTDTGSGLFQSALKEGLKITQDIGTFVINNAPDIVGGIEKWAGDAWLWIQNNVGPSLSKALSDGLKLVGDIGTLIKENAPDIGLAVGNWIHGAFTGLGSILQEALAGLFSGGAVDTSGLQGGDIAADLIPPPTVFEQLAQGAMDAMNNVFQTGLGLISGLFEGVFGVKKGTVKETFDKFFGKEGVVDKAMKEVVKFFSPLTDKITELGTLLGSVFSGLFALITDPFRKALAWIGTQMVQLGNSMPDMFSAVKGTMLSLGQALVNFGGQTQGPPKPFALGGRMQAGQPGIVGDGGRPELWVPDHSGTVISGPQAAGMMNGGGGGGSLSLHGVNIYGVENAESFLDKLMEEAGRRGLQLTF